MKIIVVGGTGTLGRPVVNELSQRHEVITVGNSRGDFQVDITDYASIQEMYQKIGAFDALVSTTGNAHFGPLLEMSEEDFYKGIKSKMMGQINLVREGLEHINDMGSFSLTTGILADDPIPMGAGLSMVNGAVNAFVMAAALEMPRGIRINAISPGLVEESVDKYGPYFPGHIPIPVSKAVYGYLKSVEGKINGQVVKIF
jgi:NAD(P)-dependent dehydrogenase (short-subunit alcohol dehydrogenase family)